MGWLIKFALGKVSGPILIYVILALFAANAVTGTLLKRAWTKNAQAVLQCENDALRGATVAKQAAIDALVQSQKELAESQQQRRIDGEVADRQNAARMFEKEIEHEQEMANMEAAINEIPDEDFFCASESASVAVLNGMRDAARRYNATRGDPPTG